MTTNTNELVEFLLEETGETLHIVVEYDADEWQFLYVRETVHERINKWETQAADILEEFRRDARRNTDREQLFSVGSFYCSLHLFDELILLHFSQPDEQGIIFGYDPIAASNLTTFVELCIPRLRDHALSEINESPTWGKEDSK